MIAVVKMDLSASNGIDQLFTKCCAVDGGKRQGPVNTCGCNS